MATVEDWLFPSARAVIEGIECECYSRVPYDSRGGAIVLLRRLDRDHGDLLERTLSADLCDLAELEAAGLLFQPPEPPEDPEPVAMLPTAAWLTSSVATGSFAVL